MDRGAAGTPGPKPHRPGSHSARHSDCSGAQPPATPPSAVPPSYEPARPFQGFGSPFDASQFRLPTLGLPPGLGTPEPTPETKREFAQFVEREILPENTIQVVVGQAKVIVLREKPRRIYAPDETVAGFQIVTDQEFAVVGKKPGRTVLNLWFPDPRIPTTPKKTGRLSYMVVVLADPERAALDPAGREEASGGPGESLRAGAQGAGKRNQGSLSRTARSNSRLVGEQVVVRGEAKDVVEAAQILRIVAEHSPTEDAASVDSSSVNVAFIPGLGDQQAAVEAIRQILQGSPNLVNLLRVPGEQQVMLMVTVAEVNRTAARTIGMDFSIVNGRFAMAQITGGLLTPGTRRPRAPRRPLPMSAGTFPPRSTTGTCSWRSRPCGP